MRQIVIAALLALLAFPATGASIALTDLPSSFLTSGDISLNSVDGRIYSQYQRTGFSAYAFTRNGQSRFLVQYDVFAPNSHWGNDELGGSVFVDVATSYDLSIDGHEVAVFFDQLRPDVGDEFFLSSVIGSGSFAAMELDGEGISSGTGFFRREEYPDQIQSGNLSFLDDSGYPDGPFVCIECGIEFSFNLVFLDFSSGVLDFNFDDARPNLIAAIDWYAGSMPYGYDLNIAVQNVPLPAAWLLFGGALLSLRLARRR